MVKGVIFAAGPKAQNVESARALDALVIRAAADHGIVNLADVVEYASPVPHADPADARAMYPVDDFAAHVALAQGFAVAAVDPDEWHPAPVSSPA